MAIDDATQQNQNEMDLTRVGVFLELGADLAKCDNEGETIADVASTHEKVVRSMRSIVNVQIESFLDLDYGEGWVMFSWLDANGIDRSLTIDADGHCSCEMPIRSGMGVSIISVRRDRVRLRFTDDLASKLEVDSDMEFAGIVPEKAYVDLLQLSKMSRHH